MGVSRGLIRKYFRKDGVTSENEVTPFSFIQTLQFTEGELDEKVVVAEIATTNPHGAMKGETQNNHTRLKEYMQKGFTLDDERLKGNGGDSYCKELLDRIRDIRSSKKVLYRQVLDLYATSKVLFQ